MTRVERQEGEEAAAGSREGALTQYARRLNGLSAKIASLRQRFVDEATPIQSDLKMLRGAVRCPDDAPVG